jgi:hypothetical protein
MTGSGLGRYARAGQPPGSGGVGAGPEDFPAVLFPGKIFNRIFLKNI